MTWDFGALVIHINHLWRNTTVPAQEPPDFHGNQKMVTGRRWAKHSSSIVILN